MSETQANETQNVMYVRRVGERVHVDDLSHEMVFGGDGAYLGQYQPNAFELEPPEIWIPARGGEPDLNTVLERVNWEWSR